MTHPLPCPLCSAPQIAAGICGPNWSRAGRTSDQRKISCAFFIGCRHAIDHGRWAVVESTQAESVVRAWNAEAERLLACLTAGWSDTQRAMHRKALGFPPLAAPKP